MDRRQNNPWIGYAIAGASCLGALVLNIDPWLALAILVIWCGTLWLMYATPPETGHATDDNPFSRDSMTQLIEQSATPILFTEKNRITMASKSARDVLGNHILGQDVRVALRHPDAIALLNSAESRSVTIHGMVRIRDSWRINRQLISPDLTLIELINQTSEADISRAHTDFVANASHELRTPLASIIGYVETLEEAIEDDSLDPATGKRFLSTIHREALRLQSLVSDLMSLSRIEAERHDQPVGIIHLKPLVEQAARDAAGPDRSPRLKLELQGGLSIRGDSEQIEQLIRNLVDNALKYGDQQQPVTITLEQGLAHDAKIIVTDRGEGIAADHIPHLTRRFYRTDPGRSRASGGTGLGLAIVKHIVERHRGRLDIVSKQGKGTNVTVRIPLQADQV
ncbi:MAG: sensor histidine kinase [Sphingomonadaceae bacterium]